MKRPTRTAAAVGAAVLAGGGVTAAALGFGGAGGQGASAAAPPATAPVTRMTLTQTQLVNGVLGYGPTTPVAARGQGIITWLPPLGSTVVRGAPLYKADNHPVVLFHGVLPLFRALHPGDAGDDVAEVEANLAALGYTGFAVDAAYTAETATAVKKWQADLGLAQTGTFDPAGAVVAPGDVRVASHTAHLGDPANGPVLGSTGTVRRVDIDLDVALQGLVRTGMSAVLTLPNRTTVDGTVTSVGTVATPGADDHHPATIAVTVDVADPTKLGGLDQAPVVVAVVSATAERVLTVPVTALVALAEGGHGVQVVTNSGNRYAAVQLGMFAKGRVEITGAGITEGTVVGVAS